MEGWIFGRGHCHSRGKLPICFSRKGANEDALKYTHGISTRLTGGPANSGCLPWGESGGMGEGRALAPEQPNRAYVAFEGWGDFLATMVRSKSRPSS